MIYLAYVREGGRFVRTGRRFKRDVSAKRLVQRSGKLGYVEQYPGKNIVWTNLQEMVTT